MSISLDDTQLFLAEVAQFSQERIASQATRPEHPLDPQTLQQLSIEALDLGLLPQIEGEGFALWEHTESQGAMAFNIGFLQTVAQANAALAFAWHRQAMAVNLLKASGSNTKLNNPLEVTFLSAGRFGLGRSSLGRYLTTSEEVSVDDEDAVLLLDWLGSEQPSVLIAPDQWQHLVWPIWENNCMRWQLVTREELNVTLERRQHGFDELSAFKVSADQNMHAYLGLPQSPKELVQQILKQDFIGLMAIGAGALKRAEQQASAYTAMRKQGGVSIHNHPAVQQMLADIDGAMLQANNWLQLFSRPLAATSLSEVLHARMQLQPQLCQAANQAMQAHGGVGYMQDVGIEKVVRDQNMLRMLAGGLLEIPLLLSGLKGVTA